MKYVLILLLLAASSLAESTVDRIRGSRDWSAEVLRDHKFHGTEACVARTRKGRLTLEVYAQKQDGGTFTEATVQLLAERFPKFHRGKMIFNNGKRFTMTFASQENSSEDLQVLLTRFSDREEVIELLRAANWVNIEFYNTRGSRVSTNRFSLRGSSRTISNTFDHCDLKFEDLGI